MSLLITLCARGGSKGIPGKNIRNISGKPLIAYSIDIAKRFAEKYNGIISLSTDSNEIRDVAKKYGLVTDYNRPENLATDSAGKVATIHDLLLYEEEKNALEFQFILDLDVTSPLRTFEDLEVSFEMFKNDAESFNLFSVSPANRNPYFNMVEMQDNGYYFLVKQGNFLTRQSSPKVYDLNASFYFYKRRFFKDKYNSVFTKKSMVYEVPHICFDLDHALDIEFMEYLIVNNKLGFKL